MQIVLYSLKSFCHYLSLVYKWLRCTEFLLSSFICLFLVSIIYMWNSLIWKWIVSWTSIFSLFSRCTVYALALFKYEGARTETIIYNYIICDPFIYCLVLKRSKILSELKINLIVFWRWFQNSIFKPYHSLIKKRPQWIWLVNLL